MRCRAFGLLLCGLSSLLPGPLSAATQGVDTLARLREVMAGIPAKARIRIVLRDGQRFMGRLDPRMDSIQLGELQGVSTTVGLVDVASVSRQRRATLEGGVAGGLVGGAFGLVINGLSGLDCSPNCDSPMGPTATVLIFGAVGVGVGALVGSAFPHWSEVWRLPGRRSGHPRPPTPPVAVVTTGDTCGVASTGETGAVGGLSLMVSGGYQMISAGSGTERGAVGGGSVGLQLQMHRVGIGPEFGMFRGTAEDLNTYLAIGRIRLGPVAPTTTRMRYLIAGLGRDAWAGQHSVKAVVLGAGYLVRGRTRVEVRWHHQLPGEYIDATLLTIGAGRFFGW